MNDRRDELRNANGPTRDEERARERERKRESELERARERKREDDRASGPGPGSPNKEEQLDEALKESFPASDPPAVGHEE